MRRYRVESTVLAAVGYEPDTSVLEVEFRTGRVYRYYRVPRTAVVKMLTADSIGGYFNREIRPRYRYREVA
ncbi:MAG TPA: KTSC domain-containing protein [Thermoanaerobaculia bacterium]|jgi:hypothetical protein